MRTKKVLKGSIFMIALAVSAISVFRMNSIKKSSASVVKEKVNAPAQTNLSPVKYNGEDMFVAKASYYDYFSDSQIGSSSSPQEISDAYAGDKNTFSKFNTRLMEIMKYNISAECPAKYSLYQGRHGAEFSDMLI